MRVGVLALQGDFREHRIALERCGADVMEVRLPEHMEKVSGLIIPGGESTTIGKLMARWGLDKAIKDFAAQGKPIFGTCAGMIVIAKRIEAGDQERLGLLDVLVRRNAYGRQVDSFEGDIEVPALGPPPVRGVFIRAPYVTSVGDGVEVLGKFDDKIVLVQQGKILASAFHPELTQDLRLHKYFLSMVSV